MSKALLFANAPARRPPGFAGLRPLVWRFCLGSPAIRPMARDVAWRQRRAGRAQAVG